VLLQIAKKKDRKGEERGKNSVANCRGKAKVVQIPMGRRKQCAAAESSKSRYCCQQPEKTMGPTAEAKEKLCAAAEGNWKRISKL
jgi:hypothetical protein